MVSAARALAFSFQHYKMLQEKLINYKSNNLVKITYEKFKRLFSKLVFSSV